jgi:hypothetical protein
MADSGKSKKPPTVLTAVADPAVPIEHRRQLLLKLLLEQGEKGAEVRQAFFDRLTNASSESLYGKKLAELQDMLKEMEEGPFRGGTFLTRFPDQRRVHVVLSDGTDVFPVVPDDDVLTTLKCGDWVLLDNRGRVILMSQLRAKDTGEEARLVRRIEGTDNVEVSMRDELIVMRAADTLRHQLDAGEAEPGQNVLVCPRSRVAFSAVPATNGLCHFRYLAQQGIPDTVAERDIGCPPAYIWEIEEHVHTEMTNPDLPRLYRLPRCRMYLLEGITGTGKTLSVHAVWHKIYEVLGRLLDLPVEELPHRVMRLRLADVLSKWLGESDKHLDRFFDEAEQLAATPYVAPDGTRHVLPVLAVLEECDGLGRARGNDAIYDRIMTTALQRLDVSRPELRDLFIIFIATTNIPDQLDAAFARRVGGEAVHFGPLDRRGFASVLLRRLRDLPLADDDDGTPLTVHRLVGELTTWLYSPNGHDPGQVEVALAGSSQPLIKYRRDFLTGAVVDRAVQQACQEAVRAEARGMAGGLSADGLRTSFDRQIRALCNQVSRYNIRTYIEVPDGAHVTEVRRIRQPMPPRQLLRAS